MPNEQKREYEILKQGPEDIMRINAEAWAFSPSLEDNPLVMSTTIDHLIESPGVASIIFSQRKQYHYDYHQTQMLIEIANIYKMLVRQTKILSLQALGLSTIASAYLPTWQAQIQEILLNHMRQDPIGAYILLKRLIRQEKIKLAKCQAELHDSYQGYVDILAYLYNLLDSTQLISTVKQDLSGHSVGDREIYKTIFRPAITPDFIYTRLMAQPPINGIEKDVYSVGNSDIVVYDQFHNIKHLYHLTPPEFKLTEDKYQLLDLARNVLSEHRPREEEFLEPERLRKTFYNIGRDLLQELGDNRGLELSQLELHELATILVRYTIGFGLLEVLLEDQKIQDITVNSPPGQSPIFIVHEEFGDCETNIIPSREDTESWATKFRILSGRPLDEANPILDTELSIPGARARVAIVQSPLNPFGISYAFRRHRDKPWTLPLFINAKMLNPLAGGLLSFFLDNGRALIFGGSRSSGKSSLLGSGILEIMRRFRIITVEDTLELSHEAYRKLGFNIQAMKVRSALTKGGTEVAADEGVRTSLRLGDSALIIGEIRSTESLALFEAMRIGALANVVAGTIHAESPYGVYDRLVNDLGVPKTSFKAADIIIISNPIRSPDGLSRKRRVVQITEVRKHWENDPLAERGFVDLMKYNPITDELEPTPELINGDSEVIKSIAGRVSEWAGNWDAIWGNIQLRAAIQKTIVEYSARYSSPEMLEASFVIQSNDQLHKLIEEVRTVEGAIDNKHVYLLWEDWMKRAIKQLSEEKEGAV